MIVFSQQKKQYQSSKNELALHLYQSILSIIPEGLAVINSEKRLLYANSTLKKILESNKKSDIQKILMNLGKIDNTPQKDKQKSKNSENDINKKFLSNSQTVNVTQGFIKLEGNTQLSQKIFQKSISDSAKNLSQHQVNIDKSQQINKIEALQNQAQTQQVNTCDYSLNQKMQQINTSEIKKKMFIPGHKQNHFDSKDRLEEIKENESQIKNYCIRSNYTASKDQTRTQYSQQSSKAQQTPKLESKQKGVSTFKETTSQQNNCTDSEILSYKGFGFNEKDEEYQTKLNQNTHNLANQQQKLTESSINNKVTSEQISTLSYFHKQQLQQSLAKNGFSNSQINNVFRKRTYQLNQKLQYSEVKDPSNNQVHQSQEQPSSQSQDQSIGINNILFMNDSVVSKPPEIPEGQKLKLKEVKYESTKSHNKTSKPVTPQESMKESEKESPQQSIDFKSPLNLKKIQKNNIEYIKMNGRNPKQENIPFTLKVKQRKNGDENLKENVIELKKTNVSSILDVIFKTNFSNRKIDLSKREIQISDKNLTNNDRNEKTEIAEKQSNLEDEQNAEDKRQIFQRNKNKKSSFMSHFDKRSEQVGFTYIQQTDTLTKIQVKFKDRDLVIQFLSVDALQENSKKDPLVLIMVQDMWQEMYQRKVQEIQKDKMRIFASLSHELRTPLNCSISMLEVLKDEISTTYHDYVEEYINPALFSNKLLLNQINDILDFVQMDSGKFKYSYLDFSVESLFRDCQKLISMQAQMKNLEIRINCDPNVPDVICSDPNRIRQIILNFLSNSLKFTKKGFIEIGITNQGELGNGLYKIYVQDTGIGISKENLETIFSFCAKVNYNKKDEGLNNQGCGLGLTISNSIAKGLVNKEIREGGIQVSSDYGFGSTFSIIIQDMNFQEKNTLQQHVKIDKFKTTLPQLVTARDDENQQIKAKQPRTPQSFSQPAKKVHSFGLCNSPTKSIIKKYNSHLMNFSLINTEGDKSSLIDIPTSSFDQSKQKILRSIMSPTEYEGRPWTDRKLIYPIQSGLKVYDSSIVVEAEDEESQKRIQIHPNFQIHNSYKFQEEDVSLQQSTKKPQSISSYNTQVSQQLDSQDQEGFISYAGYSRFNENGASSRHISASYKNIDKYVTNFIKNSAQQQHEYSIVDESMKQLSQLESCLSTHKIVEEIINRNIFNKQNCSCCQIMIVDDNQFNLYALAKTAQQFQFNCSLVSDGMQALEEIKNMYAEKCCIAPKLIFMDIEMPQKNGYEVTQEILDFYQTVGYHNLPVIIACTAYVGQEDHEKATEAGMNDFINKPILKKAFQQLIINWSNVLM